MTQCETIANKVLAKGFALEKDIIKFFKSNGSKNFNMGLLTLRLDEINVKGKKYGIPNGFNLVAEGKYGDRTLLLKKAGMLDSVEVVTKKKKANGVTLDTKWNDKVKIKDMDDNHLCFTIKLLHSYAKDRSKSGIDGYKTEAYGFKLQDWISVMTKEFNSRS